jgi:hypothetical protein
MGTKQSDLERAIRELTKPINGQYPRPWLTDYARPWECRVFTVGRNQAKAFASASVGTHDHFVDSLFNRGSETGRALYQRMVPVPSPTRRNTDRLVAELGRAGIVDVLETNVVCYSTPMSSDLASQLHVGGEKAGREIFATLLQVISPKVLIVHGSGTLDDLSKVLSTVPLRLPTRADDVSKIVTRDGKMVVAIPSLAPPAFNKWAKWSQEHLRHVAAEVRDFLDKTG